MKLPLMVAVLVCVSVPSYAASITYGTYTFGGTATWDVQLETYLPGLSHTFSGWIDVVQPEEGSRPQIYTSATFGEQTWTGFIGGGYDINYDISLLTFAPTTIVGENLYIEDLLVRLPTDTYSGGISVGFAGIGPTDRWVQGTFTSFSRVPEPNSALLLIVGIAGLARYRRSSLLRQARTASRR